jgi:ATP-binding protein involved in chromosome partitioning
VPLENVAKPLTAEDAEQVPEREREGRRRYRPGPGLQYPYYSPGLMGTSLRRPTALVELQHEVEAIGRAVDEGGPISRDGLYRIVGGRRWGPGRFRRALDEAVATGLTAAPGAAGSRHLRRARRSYARRVEVNRDEVLKALEQVIDPELRRPVTELDMVRDVEIHDGVVAFTIVLTVAGCPLRDSFEQQVEQALAGVAGVTGVELSFDVMTSEERKALTQKLRGGAPEREGVIRLPQDCRVLAIASGKGGVGKSSLAANLAVALSQNGQRVGVLDADIYGHSIPHILGIRQRPVAVDELIVPPVKDDLKLMSIGFFLESSNEPVMWRGPMLHRALEQFLTDVHWGEIDVLVVDMPPGTGDVSISLGQLLPRAEVVVVTTPQKLAQDVAARAASMAQKTNMRLLGVVENMSGDVFGSGGGEELAGELGVPLLGTVPLDPALREQGDAGAPVVSAQPDAESARAIVAIAQELEALRRVPGSGIVKALPLVG